MANTVKLKCSCGQVQGQVDIVPGAFFHVHCLCCDCQHFAKHLNQQDTILDAHGGTALLQTYPDLMKITQGHDKIACIQHTEKGLYRWHTTCCNMPLANTMIKANMPFVGILVQGLQFANADKKRQTLGPVTMKAFGKYAIGEMPQDAHPRFPLSFIPKIVSFIVKGLLGKKGKASPFFKDGKPITKSTVLS